MAIQTVPTTWQIIKTDRVTTLALAIMSAPLPLIVIILLITTTEIMGTRDHSLILYALLSVLAIELIFFIIGWHVFRKRTAWIKYQFQRGAWLDARVEAISTVKSARGNLDIPVIEVSYQWQGHVYQQKLYWLAPSLSLNMANALSSSVGRVQPGQVIKIIIDPQNPPPSYTASNFPDLSSFFKPTQGILVPAFFSV